MYLLVYTYIHTQTHLFIYIFIYSSRLAAAEGGYHSYIGITCILVKGSSCAHCLSIQISGGCNNPLNEKKRIGKHIHFHELAQLIVMQCPTFVRRMLCLTTAQWRSGYAE
uniref:Uncharacterized protein n=1 Tax=Trypanosoma congolense (strain IL3000) TaxID=1068625 RepID=G0UKW9_TRYCI|nr:hypothetical protein, unlikely [Trypanosoma congolense IL3000]